MRGLWRCLVLAALIAGANFGAVAFAAEFDALAGRTIRAIIGGSPGGGTDVIGRAFFAALQKAVPEASIRVQTIDGGQGAVAVKELSLAGGNLITVAIFANGPIYSQLLASDAVPFDLSRLNWLGSLADNRRLVAVRRAAGSDFSGLAKATRQPVMPISSAGSPGYIEAMLLNALTGLHLKVVPGFSDAQADQMLLAGDADVRLSGSFALGPMIASGDMVPVLRIGDGSYPAPLRSLPKLADVAKPGAPKELIFLLDSMNRLGRLYAAAPGTPPAAIAALRASFEVAVRDPGFLAAMARNETIGDPTSGEELAEAMRRILGDPNLPPMIAAFRDCGQKMSDNVLVQC